MQQRIAADRTWQQVRVGLDQEHTRKGFYPDDIAGTFGVPGVPVEEHLKESEVKQIDGYVSMGILTGKAPGTSAD